MPWEQFIIVYLDNGLESEDQMCHNRLHGCGYENSPARMK